MNIKNTLTALLLLLCAGVSMAEPNTIKPFNPGSYQQLLSEKANHGFMLVIWSLDCSTCIKDMELLSSIHKSRPELKIVMLSTDEVSASADIQKLLEKYQLADLENWVFASDNTQKLRYEIDPSWYSELPRTYFFSATHQREGVSGALKLEDYNARFGKMKI
jgi:hypothetical protein